MEFIFDEKYLYSAKTSVCMFVFNGVSGDSRVLKTAQLVEKLGYSIKIIGVGKTRNIERIKGYPFDIYLLPAPKFKRVFPKNTEASIERIKCELDVNIIANEIADFYKGNPPHILHTHDMYGLAVGGLLKDNEEFSSSKWIHDIHEYVQGLTDIDSEKTNYFREVEENYIRTPSFLTSVSPSLNKILKDHFSLPVEPQLVLNAPRCTDIDPLYSPTVRQALGLSCDVPLVVYSGNVKPIRGLDVIIEALAHTDDVHLVVITNNTGEYIDKILNRCNELKISDRVHFHPYVNFCNVTSFLSSADVGIHPIRRYPNAEIALPNKLFEYLHAGLPVIVSDNASMSEFVTKHDCGEFFPDGDHFALAEKIKSVLARKKDHLEWKINLSVLASKYSWEEQENKIAEIYERAKKRDVCLDDESEKKKSVLQLPVAGAGQPLTLAQGMSRYSVNAASLRVGTHKFNYKADIEVNQIADVDDFENLYNDVLKSYDIFHFHSKPLLFKSQYFYPTGLDLLFLRSLGKKVFFHFRGSEIRMNSIFEKACPYNYVDDSTLTFDKHFNESGQVHFRDYVTAICNGVFVNDPELKSYCPNATIIPRAINLDEWAYVGVENVSEVLRVVHAPSRRSVKGTDFIVNAVERLIDEGYKIEFKLVEGLNNEEAKQLYQWADVVVDQLRIGWYGVLAVEAMALGKAVVAYVREDIKHYLPYPLPIKLANPDNVYFALRDLVLNRSEVVSLGVLGRKYVESVHEFGKVSMLLKIAYLYFDESVSPTKIDDYLKYQFSKNASVNNNMSFLRSDKNEKGIYFTLKSLPRFIYRNYTFYKVELKRLIVRFFEVKNEYGFKLAIKKILRKIK